MGRFFAAIAKFFHFHALFASEGVNEAANKPFTDSAKGIHAAFAIERDQVAEDFRTLQEAVGGVLNVVEERKAHLHDISEEEEDLKVKLNGALAAAEKAQAAGDTEGYDRAKAAYDRYSTRIHEIDAEQETLTKQIAEYEAGMQRHMLRLTEIKARLQKLPQQEADTIAEFVSAKQITELNNRLMNAQDSLRDSPVSAVMDKVKNMSAQARITEKLVGTDVTLQDAEYAQLGRESQSSDAFEAVLAARKKQREATAGDAAATTEKPERASI